MLCGVGREVVSLALASVRVLTRSMLLRRVIVGAVAGYVADRCMEVATSWFYGRQSYASKAREEAVFPGGAVLATGRDVAALLRIPADAEQTQRLGVGAHRVVGMAYGVFAALLVGAGVRPMRAGVVTGAAAFTLVDEALNALRLQPSPFEFPLEAHLRGAFGHATFGVTLGTLLTGVRPILFR